MDVSLLLEKPSRYVAEHSDFYGQINLRTLVPACVSEMKRFWDKPFPHQSLLCDSCVTSENRRVKLSRPASLVRDSLFGQRIECIHNTPLSCIYNKRGRSPSHTGFVDPKQTPQEVQIQNPFAKRGSERRIFSHKDLPATQKISGHSLQIFDSSFRALCLRVCLFG